MLLQLTPAQELWGTPITSVVSTISQSYGQSFGIKVSIVLPSYSISIASTIVNVCTVTATGSTSELRCMKDRTITNILYAYHLPYGTTIILDQTNTINTVNDMIHSLYTIILEHNNTSSMVNDMVESLANLIKSKEYGKRVVLIPREYYSDPRRMLIYHFEEWDRNSHII